MSKITIVDGDIIEIIGGNDLSFAKGEIINSGSKVILKGNDGVSFGVNRKPPITKEDDSSVFYETDGHYSTVYLVCLMLGMNEYDAEELAIATEAPDTTIHDDMDFELNDTWAYPQYQKKVHSLTGGFHGIEEMLTALQFLWLKNVSSSGDTKEEIHEKTIKRLGELLHRFGDTYAHTKLDNIKPENLKEYGLDNKENKKNVEIAIKSWKGKGGKELAKNIEPWIKEINYYTDKYGYEFFENIEYQKEALNGRTFEKYIREIYLINSDENFKMYGGGWYTTEHLFVDGGYPDMIYLRPDWYLSYVKNLAWILSIKFDLDLSKLDISVFERMTKFAIKNTCSMKGIIDFEIAKKRNKKEFYIPVFYSSPTRMLASGDAVFNTDYLQSAKDAKRFTIIYMMEDNHFPIPLEGEEMTDLLNVKFSRFGNFFYYTNAYKLSFK